MNTSRKANSIGALMIAAGAVITGASVTSGAMAADNAGTDSSVNAVVVGAASADGSGDAYQCVFDDLELPTLEAGSAEAPLPAPGSDAIESSEVTGVAGVGGVEETDGANGVQPTGDATAFEVTVGGDGSTERGPITGPTVQGGESIEVSSLGIDSSGAVVMSTGEVQAGEAQAGEGIPVDATDLSEVREGTEEECKSLLGDMQPATAVAPASKPAP